MQSFLVNCFCAFLLEHSLNFQVKFSCFRCSFLNDLYCSHSELKPIANIKSVAEWHKFGSDRRVGSASRYGAGGQ